MANATSNNVTINLNLSDEVLDQIADRIAAAIEKRNGLSEFKGTGKGDNPPGDTIHEAARKRRAKKADPEPEPVDEDDTEDEDGEPDYESMSLRELRAAAKEAGIKVPRGSDKDAIIDLLVGDDDEDEDDEDEDVEDDEDEGEDDDEDNEDELTEEDLRAMSRSEVSAIAKEYGIKVPRGSSKDDIVDLLIEASEDDEDDDE